MDAADAEDTGGVVRHVDDEEERNLHEVAEAWAHLHTAHSLPIKCLTPRVNPLHPPLTRKINATETEGDGG